MTSWQSTTPGRPRLAPVRPDRRQLLLGLGTAAAAATLTACGGRDAPVPSERAVSFGFEDVVVEDPGWDRIARGLERVGANAVTVSAGRVDWPAFPWDAHPEAGPSAVSQDGRDFVAEALDALRGEGDTAREVTLTIDTLVPGLIEQEPAAAGVGPQGEPSEDFAGVSALADGVVGDRIVEFARELCERHRPERIALTELMFDDRTFGDRDLESFREFTGHDDWPRAEDGSIDEQAEILGQWRSAGVARLLERVREAVDEHGVELEADVRAAWSDPETGRVMSGHDYDLLLEHAHRIAVWNYFALSDRPPEAGARIAESLERRHPGRYLMSTGLWAQDGVVSPEDMASSLAAVAEVGTGAVAVTPASLMEDAHWDALERLWA